MNTDSRLEQANRNAAAFWLAQARAHGWEQRVRPGWTAVRCARRPVDPHRVVITEPYAEAAPLEQELADLLASWSSEQFTVEDPYRRLDLSRLGATASRAMAVMAREPGPLDPPTPLQARPGAALTVDEVTGADEFAEVERTVVDGFPLPARQPWVRGVALPAALLREPGCRAWLARRDGAAAGACLSYDDGRAAGLYWVATLPEHRSRGVARAVLEAALTEGPDAPATLVATTLGEPLYRKLGFVEHGRTHWWSKQ